MFRYWIVFDFQDGPSCGFVVPQEAEGAQAPEGEGEAEAESTWSNFIATENTTFQTPKG